MAQASLLSPPARIPPLTAKHLSQKAPLVLASAPTSSLPWPLSLLFTRETPETWAIHENLLLAALRTGDDASARQILDRLTTRFGADNERMIALKGLYDEALATSDKDLERIFNNYETALKQDPTNISLRKRRVAVLKSLGRTADAITALTVLVENSPTDAEAWAELSDLYASIGAWGQAIFCLEELLLIMPNAWSAHAQVATLHYLSAPASVPALTLALRHFARAVELNDSYLRGYYGLKLVSQKLLPLLSESSASRRTAEEEDVAPPKPQSVEKLEEIATAKLGDIVRQHSANKQAQSGYEEDEITAVRELLGRDGRAER